ncbi:glycosyltransferase, HGA-like,putative,expressed [Carex littledalei]|uniref:Glycosyltransferase, HGA-like,putative,expressed n=1 Tax=Carex littledalei TaxID=544730 RepID=A0A833QWL5_9POAL|nr:glycosyltransferase, HGA-like,putative,expressed [Carex littledalei]
MGELKMMKNLTKALLQSSLAVPFLLGFFFVLITYTVSDQFVFSHSLTTHVTQSNPLKDATSTIPENTTKDGQFTKEKFPEAEHHVKNSGNDRTNEHSKNIDETEKVQDHATLVPIPETEKKDAPNSDNSGGKFENFEQSPTTIPICNTQSPLSDTCDTQKGDIRTHGISSTVLIVPKFSTGGNAPQEWKIRPYSRKHMESIKKVTVKQLNGPQEAPPCTVNNKYPALVFALGGLIGNYWHDFTDVLVPLFIASRQFDRKVQFLVTNIQPWWLGKYETIIRALSRYEIIDFDKDNQVRCFPRVLVGLEMHKEFSIDPSRAPNGYSMVDFTKFLRSTFHLERDHPIKLSQNPGAKPRLLIINRTNYRKFNNTPEIALLAEKLGFETVVSDPKFNLGLAEFAKTVNSFDVLLGGHGAGLTNSVFLPTNAIVIQVVPYGNLEHMAKVDFGDPIVDMNLKYLEYSISAEESTLMEMLGKDHPVIKDPISIHQQGWDKVAEYYLGKQDMRVNVDRFAPTLLKALELLK